MSGLKKAVLFFGDAVILYVSLELALLVRYGRTQVVFKFLEHIGPFSVIFLLWLGIFYIADMYRDKTMRTKSGLWNAMLGATSTSFVVSVMALYLFSEFFRLTPKTNLVLFSLIFTVLDLCWRHLALKIFRTGALGVVILGDSPLIEFAMKYLAAHPHTGYKVVHWQKNLAQMDFGALVKIIHATKAQFLIIQPKLAKEHSVITTLYRLLPYETSMINFSDFYESIFEKVALDELEEGWFIENVNTRRPFYDYAKKVVDFFIALVLSFVFLPLTLFIAVLVKATSRGPIIYAQKRVGKHGNVFTLYKFRTMDTGQNGPLWTEANDSRVTSAGKVLRFTHLDELPQLWNVLRGQVSLTGPRPERVELAEKYRNLPYYDIRHIVKPGVTGWAQINYKPSASVEEAKEKLCHDIFYVKNRSLFLDLMIVLKTIRYVFTNHS